MMSSGALHASGSLDATFTVPSSSTVDGDARLIDDSLDRLAARSDDQTDLIRA